MSVFESNLGAFEGDVPDSNRFWHHMDLIDRLHEKWSDRGSSDPIIKEALEAIGWLRENMIDPGEYMRVSNERGRYLNAWIILRNAVEKFINSPLQIIGTRRVLDELISALAESEKA